MIFLLILNMFIVYQLLSKLENVDEDLKEERRRHEETRKQLETTKRQLEAAEKVYLFVTVTWACRSFRQRTL